MGGCQAEPAAAGCRHGCGQRQRLRRWQCEARPLRKHAQLAAHPSSQLCPRTRRQRRTWPLLTRKQAFQGPCPPSAVTAGGERRARNGRARLGCAAAAAAAAPLPTRPACTHALLRPAPSQPTHPQSRSPTRRPRCAPRCPRGHTPAVTRHRGSWLGLCRLKGCLPRQLCWMMPAAAAAAAAAAGQPPQRWRWRWLARPPWHQQLAAASGAQQHLEVDGGLVGLGAVAAGDLRGSQAGQGRGAEHRLLGAAHQPVRPTSAAAATRSTSGDQQGGGPSALRHVAPLSSPSHGRHAPQSPGPPARACAPASSPWSSPSPTASQQGWFTQGMDQR